MDIEFKDNEAILAVMVAMIWPICLIVCILFGIGHCIRLLLEKIIKAK
jgi:hypothetical protein